MATKWYVVFNRETGSEVARFKRGVDAVVWLSGKRELDLMSEEVD